MNEVSGRYWLTLEWNIDIDRAKHLGIDSMSAEDLKKLNKNKKLIKSTFELPVEFNKGWN